MCVWLYGVGDLHEVQVHRLSVAGGRGCRSCTLALFRADGTEDIGGSRALIAGRTEERVPRFSQRRVILFF